RNDHVGLIKLVDGQVAPAEAGVSRRTCRFGSDPLPEGHARRAKGSRPEPGQVVERRPLRRTDIGDAILAGFRGRRQMIVEELERVVPTNLLETTVDLAPFWLAQPVGIVDALQGGLTAR